jgi:Domain of unknown function (DUF4259)
VGAWNADPFGNDAAADWAWGLDDEDDWGIVRTALDAGIAGAAEDDDAGCVAVAAAEVVARGLGRPTECDAYTEEAVAFVERVVTPPSEIVLLARRALAVVVSPDSALAALWAGDDTAWRDAITRLDGALAG